MRDFGQRKRGGRISRSGSKGRNYFDNVRGRETRAPFGQRRFVGSPKNMGENFEASPGKKNSIKRLKKRGVLKGGGD